MNLRGKVIMVKSQGKVSIVIPCYNKEEYVGELLDSVIAQKWDNIELILVNDGSTDATLEVIKSYLHKLENRGFKTKLINQKNGGCCKAVHTGLLQVTGDYLAVIDADDELDSEYVSCMAGFLEQNCKYDFCTCDHYIVYKNISGEVHREYKRHRWLKEEYTMEFFLCNDPNKAAWAFVTRMDYIRKCRLIETFYSDTKGSYEPSFFISLCAYKGRMKHITKPLYFYRCNGEGLSQTNTVKEKTEYWKEYHRCVLVMFDRLDKNIVSKYERKYYEEISSFFVIKFLLAVSLWALDGKPEQENLRQTYLTYVNNWLSLTPHISYKDICESPEIVMKASELAINGLWLKPHGRIIGYGVLGKNAQSQMHTLNGTRFELTELWDRAGDGIEVKKPPADLNEITEKDIIIIFPTKQKVLDEIYELFDNCKANVIHASFISDILAQERYPQLERVVL